MALQPDMEERRAAARARRPELVGAPQPPLWADDGKGPHPDWEAWWWANLPDDYGSGVEDGY